MKFFFLKHKKKIVIFIIAILFMIAGLFAGSFWGDPPKGDNVINTFDTNSINPSVKITPNKSEELCKKGSFSPLIQQELDYDKKIKQDEFVKYLRRSLDDYLSMNYESCPKSGCEHKGLYNGRHYEDSAYNPNGGLSVIDSAYLKSKFIVLETDIALGGGESILLMFKDAPDRVFYAWVYKYSDDGYDLRMFTEYNLAEDETDIEEIRKIYINQLCDEKTGI